MINWIKETWDALDHDLVWKLTQSPDHSASCQVLVNKSLELGLSYDMILIFIGLHLAALLLEVSG